MSIISAIQNGTSTYASGIASGVIGANAAVKSEDDSAVKIQLEDEKKAAEKKAADEKAAQNREELMDKTVLAVSGDGDTATAGKEAMEALSEGIVIKKDDSMENMSLTGYTESQVEGLYKQGRITYSDYNKEIDKRERIAEIQGAETKAETKAEKTEDKKTTDAKAEETKKVDAKAEDTKIADTKATDKKVSDKKTTDAKAENSKGDDTKASQKRSEVIDSEKQSMENFSTVMNGLDGVARQDKLQSDAYDKAVENGRIKIMQDIFTGQKG